MSWDLFVQDWGNVKSLDHIPDDFEPQPIGTRSAIIDKIKEIEPTVNFIDPERGVIENEHFSLEFKMGKNEVLESFSIHARGTDLALHCIDNILTGLNLKAADGSSPDFFALENSKEGFNKWIDYQNFIMNK